MPWSRVLAAGSVAGLAALAGRHAAGALLPNSVTIQRRTRPKRRVLACPHTKRSVRHGGTVIRMELTHGRAEAARHKRK